MALNTKTIAPPAKAASKTCLIMAPPDRECDRAECRNFEVWQSCGKLSMDVENTPEAFFARIPGIRHPGSSVRCRFYESFHVCKKQQRMARADLCVRRRDEYPFEGRIVGCPSTSGRVGPCGSGAHN